VEYLHPKMGALQDKSLLCQMHGRLAQGNRDAIRFFVFQSGDNTFTRRCGFGRDAMEATLEGKNSHL
jgi:hypothetical protein